MTFTFSRTLILRTSVLSAMISAAEMGSVAPPVDSSCNPIADTICHQSRMRLRMIGESHGAQIRISFFNKCQYFFIFSDFTICHFSTSFLPSCVDSRVFIYILFRVHCTIRPQIRAMIRYILFRSCFFLQGALYVTKTVAATLSWAGKQHVISV